MLGPRRPHTSAGASNRMRDRERESDRDTDDYTQAMFWTTSEPTRSKAGSSKGASGEGARGSAPSLPLSRSTIFSAEPASKSFEAYARATTGEQASSDGQAQRHERRGVGFDDVFKSDEGDGLWEEFGGRAKVRNGGDHGTGSRDGNTFAIPTTTTRTAERGGYDKRAPSGEDSLPPPTTPSIASTSSRHSRPSTTSAPVRHAVHHSVQPPPPLSLASIKEHWYQTHSNSSSNSPPPKTPRNAERARSSPRPSTASGVLEGRFFRDIMPSSSASHWHVGLPSSRFPQPVSVCLVPSSSIASFVS